MLAVYHKISGRFSFTEPADIAFEDEAYLVGVFGTALQPLDKGFAAHAAGCAAADLYRSFDGPFLLLVYVKADRRLVIRQSFFGSPVNLWLAENDDAFVLSDSLRLLRRELHRRFTFNTQVLPQFLYNGFVKGSGTLIRHIGKLPPSCLLRLSRDGISFAPDRPVFAPYSGDLSLEERYCELVRAAVERAAGSPSEACHITLSAGFDSNCILWHIRRLFPEKPVKAYSVGGIRGVDETGTAKKIASYYGNVSFSSSLVTAETLTHMDEIVSRLEGSVYERGIFLQYELGRLLTGSGCQRIICGECADQVFHSRLFDKAPEDTFFFDYSHHPYEMASYVVLRKNITMMRSMGVAVEYPFLDSELLRLGYDTRGMNGATKEFHKAMCRRLLPENVMALVSKQGGTTDMAALFDDKTDYARQARKFRFYDPGFEITRRFPPDEARRDYYLTLAYLESFCKQFTDE